MHLRVTCALVLLALLGVSTAMAKPQTDWRAEFRGGASLMELELPEFPAAPTDHDTFHMADSDEQEEDETEETDEEGDDARFRSVESADDSEEETVAEELEEEEEDGEGEEEDASPQRFAQQQLQQQQRSPSEMRFASAVARRYDSNALPSGPLPVAPSAPWYRIAQLPPSAIGEALFQPIHNSARQFPGGDSARSLSGGVTNYAWAAAKKYPNYVYGNTNWGAPVNAQFYPQPPAPGAGPTLIPAFRPLEPFVAAATAGIPAAAGTAAAPADAAPAAAAAPAAPADAASAAEASFFEAVARSTSAATAWPSSIPPPAAYYLPPDVIV